MNANDAAMARNYAQDAIEELGAIAAAIQELKLISEADSVSEMQQSIAEIIADSASIEYARYQPGFIDTDEYISRLLAIPYDEACRRLIEFVATMPQVTYTQRVCGSIAAAFLRATSNKEDRTV